MLKRVRTPVAAHRRWLSKGVIDTVSWLSQSTHIFTKFNEDNLQLQGNGVNLKAKSVIFTFLSKFNAVQPFQSRVRHFSCRVLKSYNSPGDWARELFIPSTDSASLVVKIEKKKFSFCVWAFQGVTSQVGVFLHYFGHLCLALGAVPMGHFLDSKFSWKLGQNPYLWLTF